MWQALTSRGTIFRKGQLVLISAGGGTGKSAFTLNYAIQSKTPTLYFSADSDAFTQVSRSIAMIAGIPLEEATQYVIDDDLGAFTDDIADIPIRLVYDASPNLDTIETVMESYEEVYGDYPSLVIIDNITNVRGDSGDGDDPFSGLESLMDYFHTMARNTEACVMLLHHVTGPFNDGDKPIPMSGVKGQITRVPEMVLTLHKSVAEFGGPDTLYVSTVKNRGGKSDASGMSHADLAFYSDTMRIRDFGLSET